MKSEKGQSIVEMALVLPILLILVFGITDFGRIFHAYLTVNHAGREAAREAAIGSEDHVIRSKAIAAASGLETSKLSITITPSGKANRQSGSNVTITLTYPIDYITPFVSSIAPPLTITDTTVMRVE